MNVKFNLFLSGRAMVVVLKSMRKVTGKMLESFWEGAKDPICLPKSREKSESDIERIARGKNFFKKLRRCGIECTVFSPKMVTVENL